VLVWNLYFNPQHLIVLGIKQPIPSCVPFVTHESSKNPPRRLRKEVGYANGVLLRRNPTKSGKTFGFKHNQSFANRTIGDG